MIRDKFQWLNRADDEKLIINELGPYQCFCRREAHAAGKTCQSERRFAVVEVRDEHLCQCYCAIAKQLRLRVFSG